VAIQARKPNAAATMTPMMTCHQATMKLDVPIRMRVNNGSSALKP
jgi:hypothetical protein